MQKQWKWSRLWKASSRTPSATDKGRGATFRWTWSARIHWGLLTLYMAHMVAGALVLPLTSTVLMSSPFPAPMEAWVLSSVSPALQLVEIWSGKCVCVCARAHAHLHITQRRFRRIKVLMKMDPMVPRKRAALSLQVMQMDTAPVCWCARMQVHTGNLRHMTVLLGDIWQCEGRRWLFCSISLALCGTNELGPVARDLPSAAQPPHHRSASAMSWTGAREEERGEEQGQLENSEILSQRDEIKNASISQGNLKCIPLPTNEEDVMGSDSNYPKQKKKKKKPLWKRKWRNKVLC